MGMDFVAIVENNFSKSAILELSVLIDESETLRRLYKSKHQANIDHNPSHFHRKSTWDEQEDRIMNEFNLQRIWNHLKEDTSVENIDGMCFDTNISTYFGWITVYEKSISISLFPEHKYGNLRNQNTSKYVFEFIRELAKLFKASEIVYCCDSYYRPSILLDKAMMGWTIDGIINYGNNLFGKPPIELNKAIENLYFIDKYDLNLNELDPKKEVWSRAKYEYNKEEKGEPPYNIA